MRLSMLALCGSGALCSAAGAADSINFLDSHVTRQVDCGGGDLAVSGSDDVLTVRHCKTISVIGDHNRLNASLLRTSTIATVGNHNHVVFEDEPGFDPQVSSTGADNEIVPEMADKDRPAPANPR